MSGCADLDILPVRSRSRLAVASWFADHAFQGRVVLPAVETMHLLAHEVERYLPHMAVANLAAARFGKLLVIVPQAGDLNLEVELLAGEHGGVTAILYSRKKFKTMSRLIEHGRLCLGPASSPARLPVIELNRNREGRQIDPLRLYAELVPFGVNYRTLQALTLGQDMAWGDLLAPLHPPLAHHAPGLGSPFPLDGAFHAACVHGQQYVDFIPFPVGFDQRQVLRPTVAGGTYHAVVRLVELDRDELLYDLLITADNGDIFEVIHGLRMRDVSAGQLQPPGWINQQGRFAGCNNQCKQNPHRQRRSRATWQGQSVRWFLPSLLWS